MRYLERDITLAYDSERCNGCGLCTQVCPHAVFAMEGNRAVLRDKGACMECGACARNCEQEAIEVRSGVGCAAGIIAGWLRGTEASCDCSSDKQGAACC